MKKIIYVMNVDWNWIKQRPHFIAEELSKKYEVLVLYQYKYGRKNLQKCNETNIKLKPIYTIPKITGIENLRWINDNLIACYAKKLIYKEKPDYIFLTYPTQVNIIPDGFEGKVIYDCMDNHMAFIHSKTAKNRLKKLESQMINSSNFILTSSQYLLDLLKKSYKRIIKQQKFLIVRNAYNGKIQSISEEQYVIDKNMNFAYIGTIDSWFDFDLILKVLDDFDNIKIHLFGPCNVEIPIHSRIEYHGILEHDSIYKNIMTMDGLIMPFIINEIIEAVDPVKLYEYINFNKMIVCPRYPEIVRFDKFVEFYSSKKEFEDIIHRCVNKPQPKYNLDKRMKFLENNTWECRGKDIISLIEQN